MLTENYPGGSKIRSLVSEAGISGGLYAWNYGDFNGDGLNDVFVITGEQWSKTPAEGAGAAIFINNGSNEFVYSPALIQDKQGAIHPRKIAIADLNGDAVPDIVLADHGYDADPFPGAEPIIFLSSSLGYTRVDGLDAITGFHHSAAIGDIDYDGDQDIFFTDDGGFFLINDGTGGFVKNSSLAPKGLNGPYFTSELLDVDGDGYLDLIVAGHEFEDAVTKVFWGTGAAGFEKSPSTVILPNKAGYGIIVDVDAADLDGDGIDEVIINRVGSPPENFFYGPQPDIQILHVQSDRSLVDISEVALSSVDFSSLGSGWVSWVTADDLDGDGDIDLYIDDLWLPYQTYLKNNGVGEFTLFELKPNYQTGGDIAFLGLSVPGSLIGFAHYLQDENGAGTINAYQWLRDGESIKGATGSSYRVVNEDTGHDLSIELTYQDGQGYTNTIRPWQSLYIVSEVDEPNAWLSEYDFWGGSYDVNHTASFELAYNKFVLEKKDFGSAEWLLSLSSGGGNINLHNVKRLQFTDTCIALDIDDANSAGGIYRTYQAAFNRTPDKAGFGYWIDRADKGASAVQMAEEFVWSQEFQAVYGVVIQDQYLVGSDVESVVEGFYRNVLGREPDRGGLEFFAGVIENQERTVGRVLAEIADSVENREYMASVINKGVEYDLWMG